MNLTLDTSRYLAHPIARKTTQVEPVSRSASTTNQPAAQASPPVSPPIEVSEDIELRARQLRRHYFTDDQISSRSQQAIRSYSSITEIEARDRVSELFGLDEYA